MNIGSAIQTCRVKRKLTQRQLAERAKCSTSYLSMLENSERVDPKLSTVKNIADALGVPIEILFFLGSSPEELTGLNQELAGQLAVAALGLLNEQDTGSALLS